MTITADLGQEVKYSSYGHTCTRNFDDIVQLVLRLLCKNMRHLLQNVDSLPYIYTFIRINSSYKNKKFKKNKGKRFKEHNVSNAY